jgi:hypothetical protein
VVEWVVDPRDNVERVDIGQGDIAEVDKEHMVRRDMGKADMVELDMVVVVVVVEQADVLLNLRLVWPPPPPSPVLQQVVESQEILPLYILNLVAR